MMYCTCSYAKQEMRKAILIGILIGCILAFVAHAVHLSYSGTRKTTPYTSTPSEESYKTPIVRDVATKKYRRG
jgi:Mg/Co/Ni transporter MgtE